MEEISLQSLPGPESPNYSSEIFGTDFSAEIFLVEISLQFFLGKYFLCRDSLEETVLQSLFGREYYSSEIFGTNFSAEFFW